MSWRNQEPQNITVDGKSLVCPVCGNDLFRTRKILLNTRAATLFDVEFANRRAYCYVCSNCQYIYWFHE